jgi:hypothetical protein
MPASNWTKFEGVNATHRGIAMVKEARRISGLKPRISQGGLSGGVAASAGTHVREGFDFATAGWPLAKQRKWEEACWKVGFAGWHRLFIWNVWPEHQHDIPKGGDLSRGARAQEAAFRNQRDGLAGNRPYPRIGKYASQTWEKYQAGQAGKKIKIGGKYYPDIASVSVYYINSSRKTGKFSRHVWYAQRWLAALKFYKAPADGKWGPKTQAAMDAFRRSLGWKGSDTTGAVGMTSLTLLRNEANSKKKLRTEK